MLTKIGTGSNSTTAYVTFTADTGVSTYRVYGITTGKDSPTALIGVISMQNVLSDVGTTSTVNIGGPTAATGMAIQFPASQMVNLDTRTNAFVTLTWGAAATSTLMVHYDKVAKQP